MMKKIFVVICVLLVISIPIVLMFSGVFQSERKGKSITSAEIKRKTSTESDDEKDLVSTDMQEVNDDKVEVSKEDKTEQNVEMKVPTTSVNPKKETTTSEKNTETNKQTEQSKNQQEVSPKENNVETTPKTTPETPKETTSTPQVEEKKNTETKKEPEVDEEYLRLMERLFKTNSECLQKGIELGFEDLTITNTYCQSYGYKGKIIGYELYLVYPNETKLYR